MSSERPCPVLLRWAIVGVGLLGFLLAVDAIAVLIFMLLEPIFTGSPANPYAGMFAFVLVPAAVVIGLAAAWGAYRFWRVHAPAAEQPAATGASR
ncbi:MAG TPA: hypothetical protein VK886_00935 [Vicinamibacterales bacterium]|nr:hypothetical protein [Vicinamibacterales bacterium]